MSVGKSADGALLIPRRESIYSFDVCFLSPRSHLLQSLIYLCTRQLVDFHSNWATRHSSLCSPGEEKKVLDRSLTLVRYSGR